MLNLCVFEGRLTRDPDRKTTPSGMTIAEAFIAVGNKKDKGDSNLFLQVNFFGKLAENFLRFFKKGSPVIVQGSLNCMSIKDSKHPGETKLAYSLHGEGWNFPLEKPVTPKQPEPAPLQDPLGNSAITDDVDMPF